MGGLGAIVVETNTAAIAGGGSGVGTRRWARVGAVLEDGRLVMVLVGLAWVVLAWVARRFLERGKRAQFCDVFRDCLTEGVV